MHLFLNVFYMAEQLTPEQLKELQEISKLSPEEQKTRVPAFLKKLSPGQIEALKQMQAQPAQQCIFCKIANKEIPSKIIYETDSLLAFLDIKPANPGHVLVIPKEHYQFLTQMPDTAVAELFKAVKLLCAAVFEVTGAEGVEVRQRNGAAAGQIVPHVHVHIIPRFKNDGIITDWKPKELPEEQFTEIQRRLISKIKEILPIQQTKKEEKGKKKKLPKIPPRLP